MGDTHQTPFGFDFLHAPSVVFDMPKDRFDIHVTLDPQVFPRLGEQVGFRLFPETP